MSAGGVLGIWWVPRGYRAAFWEICTSGRPQLHVGPGSSLCLGACRRELASWVPGIFLSPKLPCHHHPGEVRSSQRSPGSLQRSPGQVGSGCLTQPPCISDKAHGPAAKLLGLLQAPNHTQQLLQRGLNIVTPPSPFLAPSFTHLSQPGTVTLGIGAPRPVPTWVYDLEPRVPHRASCRTGLHSPGQVPCCMVGKMPFESPGRLPIQQVPAADTRVPGL